jgi:hypothetical protein
MKSCVLVFFAGCSWIVCTAAQAEDISALDTGAGLYSINTVANAPVVGPNWAVSLLSTVPAGQIPPGGIPTGSAYLMPNDMGFPFPSWWLPNDSTSSWITYSSPPQVGGDITSDTFQYQATFIAASSGVDYVSWLSDNSSTFLLNGVVMGTRPNSSYAAWNAPIAFNLVGGDSYTVDFDVFNYPQWSENPTGLRVEFTGDPGTDPVPEAPSPIIYLVLALPAGAQALRRLRQSRCAAK